MPLSVPAAETTTDLYYAAHHRIGIGDNWPLYTEPTLRPTSKKTQRDGENILLMLLGQ